MSAIFRRLKRGVWFFDETHPDPSFTWFPLRLGEIIEEHYLSFCEANQFRLDQVNKKITTTYKHNIRTQSTLTLSLLDHVTAPIILENQLKNNSDKNCNNESNLDNYRVGA
uniref:Uncharacterized protein n=1 Tax=Acrobeloides nanus TaxID=290746 RepID=A0A914C6Q6_9BILA